MEREKLTEAECLNLRTAALTSSMRSEPGWAATLDALAEKLLRLADQIAAED